MGKLSGNLLVSIDKFNFIINMKISGKTLLHISVKDSNTCYLRYKKALLLTAVSMYS